MQSVLRRSSRIPPHIAGAFLVTATLALAPVRSHGQTVEIVHSFDGSPALPSAGLVEGPDGAFYGTSGGGGAYGRGTVYRITSAGEATILHSFSGGSDGLGPLGGLLRVGDDFYGTTSGSPPASHGTVFRISTTTPLETIFSFSGTDGSRPFATLIQGSDGWLYGTALFGGTAGSNGTLYRLLPDGTNPEVLHHFGGTADGRTPRTGVVEGEPGVFYGVTPSGGALARGTLYRWSQANGYALLHSFTTATPFPQGELYRDPAGDLWGTTAGGGTSACGTVFKRPASSGVIATVHSFACGASGSAPSAGLVAGPGGLWGTTAGNFSSGATVYRLDPATSQHTVVHTFPGTQVNPRGRLLVAGDGGIYGVTEGSSSGLTRGTVYRIDPAAGNAFATVRAFGQADDGWEPQSLAAAEDGTLYGTTRLGGASGLGTAFHILPDGTFATLHAFDDSDPFSGVPSSTRVMLASDGLLYGTRSGGGSGGRGTIFRMTPSGVRTNLVEFQAPAPSGSSPLAALTEASDGHLYGTTVNGGPSNWGTAFRITKAGAFTTLASFSGVSTGSEPLGRLVEGSDGLLYGTAVLNGWNGYSAGWGNVYRLPSSGGIQPVYSFFDTTGGYSPNGGLTLVGPHRFFGTAQGGTGLPFGLGVVFELTVSPASAYRVVHHFQGGAADGAGASRELVPASDGWLYGTTYGGGSADHGTVYRIRADGTGYETVHFFAGTDGSRADGLTEGPDGNLYGITAAGGPGGGGVVFRLRLTPLVDAGGPYAVDEGGSVEVSATANRSVAFAWDLDADPDFETSGPTVTYLAGDRDGPGAYEIRVRGTDDAGLFADDTATVVVNNVAPVVDAGPDVVLIAGETLARAGSFTDPGPDSWSATADYGDGSGPEALTLDGFLFQLGHRYATAGTFLATVVVSDDDGGAGSDTVVVQVRSVEDSIQGLIAAVQGLVDGLRLNQGQGNSFISKLEAALKQLQNGNVTPAINQLEAFVNEMTSYVQSGKLTPEEGQPLIDIANHIIAALS